MKKIIANILIIILFINIQPFCYAEENYEEEIWNYLMEYYNNPYGVAAIMGNMAGESNCLPFRCENDLDELNNYKISRRYVKKINSGLSSPTEQKAMYFSCTGAFEDDSAIGFGLCGWSYWGYKYELYQMAVESNRQIDDYTLQCDMLIKHLSEKNRLLQLNELLKTTTNISNAAAAFRSTYERSKYNELSTWYRAHKAKEYYEKFTGEPYTKKLIHNYWIFGTYNENLIG